MSALAKSGTPSLATVNLPAANRICGLVAGEALVAGDACYVKSDGKAWKSTGAAANAAAVVDGFADVTTAVGEAVTLLFDCEIAYAAGMTPGTPYYLSGTTAGGLDTAPSTGGNVVVARAVSATRLRVSRTDSINSSVTLTSNGASVAEGKLATVAGVDLNVTTKTTLYTVPASKIAYITKVVLRDATISLTTASFGVGYDASAVNVIADATHTGLTGPTLYEVVPAKVGALEGAAAAVLGLKCSIAQGAAATCAVDVFGYLVDA